MRKLNQNGLAHLFLVVFLLVVVAVVGFAGWRVLSSKKDKPASDSSQTNNSGGSDSASAVYWNFDGSKWNASDTPPSCPEPLKLTNSPVDVSKATAILYPGQTRGNNYKPHGGFRFDGSKNEDISVKVPMDAYVTKGSRYIEQGETQYMFFFVNSCGIEYKFDHLLTLSSTFQALADKLPAAKVDDSRTTDFDPPVAVKAGDVIATAVGFKKTGNASVDFGVYDLRAPNAASKNSIYATTHDQYKETDFFGICWFDLLPGSDAGTVKSLPAADGQSGKTSDYCK